MREPTEQSLFTRRGLLTGALGAGVLWATAACGGKNERVPDCGNSHPTEERKEIGANPDTLTAYNWHIPGVEHTSDGYLRVTPTGSETTPMNMYGARLDAQGDFAIGADIALNRGAQATIHLKDSVALSFDGYVQSPSGVRVVLGENGGRIDVWRNEHDPPTTHEFTLTDPTRQKQLVIERRGGRMAMHIGDEQVGDVPDVFDSGRIWFGLAAKEAPYTIGGLTARELQGGNVAIVDTSTAEFPACADGLQAKIAKKTNGRLAMGTAMRLAPVVDNDRYGSLLIGEFGSFTTENAGKFRFLHPRKGDYTFGELDSIIDLAERHHKDTWLHTLVWHNELPDWVKQAPPDQLRDIMVGHITTVMSHTKGKVKGVDVLNEILENYSGNYRDTLWHRAMGPEYVALALQTAHHADPNAELWINEYGWDKDNPKDKARFQRLFAIAKDMKARGIRLDGIGLQGHVLESPRDSAHIATLKRRMDAFGALGKQVRISEIDVTAKAGPKSQAKQFGDMLRLAIDQPNCTGFTIWGIGGPYVSTASINNPRVENRTPWDAHLQSNDIYKTLQKVTG